ncbi:zinc-regulated transporter 1 [Microcella alkaliphila]|uniref:Zinc-regulated transporter 1 n=1 Tax=Microcella alkaliphila TaxID=279828 RepID=A0A0U5BRB4_9MICO|nr:zinc-regulated transporter 1 [Microcella alkaliphila]
MVAEERDRVIDELSKKRIGGTNFMFRVLHNAQVIAGPGPYIDHELGDVDIPHLVRGVGLHQEEVEITRRRHGATCTGPEKCGV